MILKKKQRWDQTIEWIQLVGCTDLLVEFPKSDQYFVYKISSYIPYEFYDLTTKVKPQNEEIKLYLETLIKKWSEILNYDFFVNTRPISFSGAKARRLIVEYNSSYIAPWGSWSNHLVNGRPSLFTELRQNVNDLIHPHGVDHIDFIEVIDDNLKNYE